MAQEHDHHLTEWARAWNELWPALQEERAPPLTVEQSEHLVRLYSLVAADLRRIGAFPNHRWQGASSQDRVYALFECLVTGLLGRRSPLPTGDGIRGLLLTIADKRGIDRYRKEQRERNREVELGDELPAAPFEPGIEEIVSSRLDEAQLVEAAFAYWSDLPWPDGEIMRLRHRLGSDRCRPFASIAAHLGAQYKPDTVEKMYKRTLARTREHLRGLGLLGD